jgi:hypothetical protein
MGNITQDGNAPMNTLKPQPGQWNAYDPKFHPLPGEWARDQLNQPTLYAKRHASRTTTGSQGQTEIQRAIAAERAQHEYWEKWQGVRPGKAIYENPRELQNTLLPSAKYGTEGRGYG